MEFAAGAFSVVLAFLLHEFPIRKPYDWLKRRIRGPGQLVDSLPNESLANLEKISDYLTRMNGFLDDEEARYLGIYGMGGVGKTTLLEIFNNNLLRSNTRRRFDHIFFITLSRSPNIEEIKKKIEEEIGGHLSSLRKSRFLLLLDDVWEKVDLRKMKVDWHMCSPKNTNVNTNKEI